MRRAQWFAAALAAAPESAQSHHAQGAMLLRRAKPGGARPSARSRRLNPLERGDCHSIALAVGRQMVPFRWIDAALPRWYLWHPKATWAFFVALVFAYVTVNIYFPPPPDADRLLSVDRNHLPGVLVGSVVMNILLVPFTFDALAASAAQLSKRRFVGTTWLRQSRQVLVLVILIACHLLASLCGLLPPLVILTLCVGACGGFVKYALNVSAQDRKTHPVSMIYAFPLAILVVTMMALVSYRPRECLVQVAIFAVLTFFSDNVLRWVQRREA